MIWLGLATASAVHTGNCSEAVKKRQCTLEIVVQSIALQVQSMVSSAASQSFSVLPDPAAVSARYRNEQ